LSVFPAEKIGFFEEKNVMKMEESNANYVPEDILMEAEEAAMQILPEKCRDAYDREFKMFEYWMNLWKIKF